MRPVLVADILAAAQSVAAASPQNQKARAAELVARACAADRYRKAFGRAHPDWGNGTLLSAARPHFTCESNTGLQLQAMRHVIDAILARQSAKS